MREVAQVKRHRRARHLRFGLGSDGGLRRVAEELVEALLLAKQSRVHRQGPRRRSRGAGRAADQPGRAFAGEVAMNCRRSPLAAGPVGRPGRISGWRLFSSVFASASGPRGAASGWPR